MNADEGSMRRTASQPVATQSTSALPRVVPSGAARNKRQDEFVQIFELKQEELLEDYSCAYQSDKLLYHGRMYVSRNFVCFHSQIFKKTIKILELKDIQDIQKRNTAIVFPNAIEFTSKGRKFLFASFLYRDQAFKLVTDLWEESKRNRAFKSLAAKEARKKQEEDDAVAAREASFEATSEATSTDGESMEDDGDDNSEDDEEGEEEEEEDKEGDGEEEEEDKGDKNRDESDQVGRHGTGSVGSDRGSVGRDEADQPLLLHSSPPPQLPLPLPRSAPTPVAPRPSSFSSAATPFPDDGGARSTSSHFPSASPASQQPSPPSNTTMLRSLSVNISQNVNGWVHSVGWPINKLLVDDGASDAGEPLGLKKDIELKDFGTDGEARANNDNTDHNDNAANVSSGTTTTTTTTSIIISSSTGSKPPKGEEGGPPRANTEEQADSGGAGPAGDAGPVGDQPASSSSSGGGGGGGSSLGEGGKEMRDDGDGEPRSDERDSKEKETNGGSDNKPERGSGRRRKDGNGSSNNKETTTPTTSTSSSSSSKPDASALKQAAEPPVVVVAAAAVQQTVVPVVQACSHISGGPSTGQAMVNVLLPIPVADVFYTFFDDKNPDVAPFWNELHANEPLSYTELSMGQWNLQSDNCCLHRPLAFRVPLKHPLGPKSTRVQQEQRIHYLNKDTLVMETTSASLDVPYGDTFTTDTRWVMSAATGPNGKPATRVTVNVDIKFTKNVWLKGVIQSSAVEGISTYFPAWAEKAQRLLAAKARAAAAAAASAAASSPTKRSSSSRKGSSSTRSKRSTAANETPSKLRKSRRRGPGDDKEGGAGSPSAAAAAAACEEEEYLLLASPPAQPPSFSLNATTSSGPARAKDEESLVGSLIHMAFPNLPLPRLPFSVSAVAGCVVFLLVCFFILPSLLSLPALSGRVAALESDLRMMRRLNSQLKDRVLFMQLAFSALTPAFQQDDAAAAASSGDPPSAGDSLPELWRYWKLHRALRKRVEAMTLQLSNVHDLLGHLRDDVHAVLPPPPPPLERDFVSDDFLRKLAHALEASDDDADSMGWSFEEEEKESGGGFWSWVWALFKLLFVVLPLLAAAAAMLANTLGLLPPILPIQLPYENSLRPYVSFLPLPPPFNDPVPADRSPKPHQA